MWNFNLFGVGGIDWEESPHEAPFGLVVLWFVLSEWFAAAAPRDTSSYGERGFKFEEGKSRFNGGFLQVPG